MARYPVYTEYNDNGAMRANHFECKGLKELKATLEAVIEEGVIITGVCKVNKSGEYMRYDYKKLIKKGGQNSEHIQGNT